MKKVLILGGPDGLSVGHGIYQIIDQLLVKNHEVTVYGKESLAPQPEIEQLIGDRSDYKTFEETMKKKNFDIVIDMLCMNEQDAKSIVRAFGDNVEQLIVTSSIAAYKRPYQSVPTKEDMEELYDDPAFGYAFHKAEVERYLQKVVKERNLPITVIRPSLTYAPGAPNVGILRQNYGIIDRIKKGKPLVMFGDGTTPWSFTFASDLAKGYVGAVGNPNTFGKSYHVTSEQRHIWEDLYLEFGKIVGKEPEIVHIPTELLYQADPNLFGHIYFEKSFSGIFDNSKIKKDVKGLTLDTPLHEGLSQMVEYFESQANTIDPDKEKLEDQLVRLYKEWSEQVSLSKTNIG